MTPPPRSGPTNMRSGANGQAVGGRGPANAQCGTVKRGSHLVRANTEYDQDQYAMEKELGIREASGKLRLTRLRPIHRTMILLYAEGKSIKSIAEEVDRSYINVWQIINDPLAKELISRSIQDAQEHLKQAQVKAITAVSEGLESVSFEDQMKAVDRYVKLAEHLGIGEGANETAEDVVQRILASVNVQVNVGCDSNTEAAVTVGRSGERED